MPPPLQKLLALLLSALVAGAALAAPRTVANADVHGAWDEYVRLLTEAGLVDAQLAWHGGDTQYLQLGDLIDRGPDSRKVLDLLMRLEREAPAAGGRVTVLLGNHELMNLTGDLRYVSKEEFASFADLETAEDRDAALARLVKAGRFAGADGQPDRAAFDAKFPPGYYGHQKAFAPDGLYGRWLLQRPLLVKHAGRLFVHGGAPADLAKHPLEAYAAGGAVQQAIADYAAAYARSKQIGLVDPDTVFDMRVDLARSRVATLTGEERAEGDRLITALETHGDAFAISHDGPLWYRGTAMCNPVLETDTLKTVLGRFDAKGIVMGHTVTADTRITTRMQGLATLLDTGMLAKSYQGRPSALLIAAQGDVSALYAGPPPEITSPLPQPRRVGSRPARLTDDQLETWLLEAVVVGRSSDGVVQLEKDGVKLNVRFVTGPNAAAWRHEIAAYRLDRELGLDMVPVTIARTIEGTEGALQLVVERAVSATRLGEGGVRISEWCAIAPQNTLVASFDALTGNLPRELADLYVSTDDGLIRMTGFGRAFGSASLPASLRPKLPAPGPELARRLRALDRTRLEASLGGLVPAGAIGAVLARRDQLLGK